MTTFWVMTPAGWAPLARDLDLGETGVPLKLRTKFGWASQAPYPQGKILAVKDKAGFVPVMYMYPAIEQPYVTYLPGQGDPGQGWSIGTGQGATSVIGPDGKRYVVVINLSVPNYRQTPDYLAIGPTDGSGAWAGTKLVSQNQVDGGDDFTEPTFKIAGRTTSFTPFNAAAAIAYGEEHKTIGRTIKHYRIVAASGIISDLHVDAQRAPAFARAYRRFDIPLTQRVDGFTGKPAPAVKDVAFDEGAGELLFTAAITPGGFSEGFWQSPNYTRAEFAALPNAVFQAAIDAMPDGDDHGDYCNHDMMVRVNMYYD